MFAHLAQRLCYLIALALVIGGEHKVLARSWRHYEMSRWTLGVATVMGMSLPLVFLGGLDWVTWAWMAAGFGIAGAVTGALYTNDKTNINARALPNSLRSPRKAQ